MALSGGRVQGGNGQGVGKTGSETSYCSFVETLGNESSPFVHGSYGTCVENVQPYWNLNIKIKRPSLEVAQPVKTNIVLLSDAPFYILDEPFTQVDPVNIDEVKALIRERSVGHGIIVTDHNYDAISSVADNLFVITDGYTSPVRSREDLARHGYLRAED